MEGNLSCRRRPVGVGVGIGVGVKVEVVGVAVASEPFTEVVTP
jgi:hypothetical protein